MTPLYRERAAAVEMDPSCYPEVFLMQPGTKLLDVDPVGDNAPSERRRLH